jgi:hypothetical protein
MVSPEFSPTNSHGGGVAARTLCVVGFTRDLRSTAGKSGSFKNRGKLFEVEYLVREF